MRVNASKKRRRERLQTDECVEKLKVSTPLDTVLGSCTGAGQMTSTQLPDWINHSAGMGYTLQEIQHGFFQSAMSRDLNKPLASTETDKCLREQNERLQLLLSLTKSITSNLTLKEVLHTVASNVREVMHCDAANIALPASEPGTFRLHALDFPGSKGFFDEEQTFTPSDDSPPKRALATLKPVSGRVTSTRAASEGLKTVCFIPLVNHGRALGYMSLARTTDDTFTEEDVDFLSQAAGQIAIAIENALAYEEILKLKEKLAQEKLYLEEEIRSEMNFEQIIGKSSALKQVLKLVETVAPSDSTVLLLGETGTGKELIARAIHEHSRRKERTFVKLNCAAIPTGLLESELFGHEKGAFTGAITQKIGRLELSDHGTLFLDEVGDIPTEIQPKLLRALQEREFERLGSTQTRKVNVRLIAATNRDLEKMVATREFRSDLFYRLNVFPIRIPPLRDRREDIPLLVSYFVQKFAKQMQKRIEAVPIAVMKGLTAWDWPGNIRELENFIERAVILTSDKALEAPLGELRQLNHGESAQPTPAQGQEDIARIVKETINALHRSKTSTDEHANRQREEIVRALTQSKGRVGGVDGAAVRLGINRTTLLSRIKKLGIDPRQYT
jgi:formate hydrogenlyase transcriptional activator